MPVYEYVCRSCGMAETFHLDVGDRDRPVHLGCMECGTGRMKRRFSFHPAPVMHSHFNVSVGKEISDMGQFRDEAKRVNERSEAAGRPSHAEPVDLMDLRPPDLDAG
jgi:putative FmdB family regulatory protein